MRGIKYLCYNYPMDYVFNFWLGVLAINIAGTLAHFIYEWSHHNRILGLFTAVNESTWEHIKIALTPSLAWSLYDGFFYGLNPNYFCAKLISLIVIVVVIPAIFYTYKKFTKKPILPIDIATFYIAIVLSQLTFYLTLNLPPMIYALQFLSCIGLFVFFGCYMTLTLAPLRNFIFQDPITGKYGFCAHTHPFKSSKASKSKSTKK